MLSSRFAKLAATTTAIASYVRAAAFVFDKNLLLFRVLPNEKLVRHVNNSYTVLCLWLVLTFLLIPKYWHEHNFERCYLTMFYSMGASAGLLDCFSILRWYSDEMCRTVNSLLQFLRYFQENYMPNFQNDKDRLNWYFDILLVATGLTWIGLIFMVFLLCLYDPRGVIFLGAWIPKQYYSFFPYGLLICMFHGYFGFIFALNAIVAVGLCELYMFYFTAVFTKELKLGNKLSKYRSTHNFRRNPENLRHIYRCFQIINSNAMSFMGKFIGTSHALLTIIPVLCNFILFRYWNVLSTLGKGPLILGLPVSIGYWTFVLQIGKYLHGKSNKILSSWIKHDWENELENKVMRKFNKSCRPVVICWNKNLVLAKITQLKYIKCVMRATFKVLLTTRT